MNDLTNLERDVLKMLLEGDDAMLTSLRKQLNLISVIERKMSGVGFFTMFEVLQTDVVVVDKSFKFGDVQAEISGLEYGAGFLLYVKNGILELLEAYTYDEQWPNNTDDFKLSYINGKRDFEKIKPNWL